MKPILQNKSLVRLYSLGWDVLGSDWMYHRLILQDSEDFWLRVLGLIFSQLFATFFFIFFGNFLPFLMVLFFFFFPFFFIDFWPTFVITFSKLFRGRSLLGPNFFDLKLTRLTPAAFVMMTRGLSSAALPGQWP